MNIQNKPEAVVVLSGGAARGLAHIGVLREIEKKFDIKAIIGTSMGALVGGMYCSGLTPDDIEKVFRLNITDYLKLIKVGFKIEGVVDDKYFCEKLHKVFATRKIENGRIPFTAISYDLNTRNSIIVNSGSYINAVRASSALPIVFKPLKVKGRILVDGGVEYPLPLEFAKAFPKEWVRIVSSVYAPVPISPDVCNIDGESEKISSTEYLQTGLKSMMYNQAFLALRATMENRTDLYINPYAKNLQFWDFHEVDKFSNIGTSETLKALEKYKNKNRSWQDDLKEQVNEIKDFFESYLSK